MLRARQDSGFTVIETMVAAAVLLLGVLGTFALLDAAQEKGGEARAREAATNVAREILEDVRDVPFAQVDSVSRQQDALTALDGRSAPVVVAGAARLTTKVQRRGYVYDVAVRWCSVDDQRDGYGAHAADVAWCPDASSTGSADSRPQDLKRMTVETSWSLAGSKRTVASTQTATFGSGGAAVAPPVPAIALTSPGGLSSTAPVVTSNPPGGIVTFRGSATGASDMRFTVDGVERSSGITNNGDGTWSLAWNVTTLADGVYTIGAIAIDGLGTRSAPAVLQVRLARGAPTPVTNVTGGYNEIYDAGAKKQVVELAWDASADGSVTGYEVLKGTTVVCAAGLSTTCMDLSPASTGDTAYTVRTLYTTATGAAAAVSTTYTVTAPGTTTTTTTIATTYGFTTGTAHRTGCMAGSTPGRQDLTADYLAATGGMRTLAAVVGCMPTFPAGTKLAAGTATFNGFWVNASSNRDCAISFYLYLNGGPTYLGWGNMTIPRNNPSAKSIPISFTTTAHTFSATDRLSFWTLGGATSKTCSDAGTGFEYGHAGARSTLTLPLVGGSTTTGSSLQRPGAPTGLTAVAKPDGTTELTWTAPTGTPAVEFYRIYRDGQDHTDRIDTAGATGTTVTWTDTATGGTQHTYRVTAASAQLTESATFAGPVTR